ncbi:PCI domain-containing protein [Pedobacter sp. P26]|uniref:PCI domain-containing protein n=1 Tax=Pedobacter sp. P26 TaxID=3423956 RepID=UPI003D6700AB
MLISYSENEKKLLEYLEQNEKITLKEFSKLLRSSYRKAQKVLVNLILTNVIKSHTTEREEYFTAVR